MDLFAPDAPWSEAAAHVDVFKIYPQFATQSSDAQLAAVINGLKARQIALGLEFGFLGDHALCGKIEGHCGEAIDTVARRIQGLGGDIAYLAMDEPLWFGHVVNRRDIPQATIAEVAQDVARQVAILRRYFPAVKIGDIEPVGDRGAPSDYLAEIDIWMTEYETATGHNLDFFHADMTWGARSVKELQDLARLVHGRKIAFGVIYNGSPKDATDVDWTRAAMRHAIEVERSLIPDQAILQTWMAHPRLALPETKEGTMTSLVNEYAALDHRNRVER